MTGWLVLIAMTVVVGGALWRFGRFPRGGVELLATALLFGVAGYAWQGSPSLKGQLPPPRANVARPDSEFAMLRDTMFGPVTGEARVLATVDAFQRQGLNREAIAILRTELDRRPRSADLWMGLGNALILHGGGLVTPAAELAFRRAEALSPESPGPPFFLGLAFANTGQLAQARMLWAGLLARTPMNAPWRTDVALRIRAVDAATGEGVPAL